MRLTFLTGLLVVLAGTTEAQSSGSAASTHRFSVRASIGVVSTSLSDASAFHESVADSYRALGIPIPTQQPYGPSVVFGAEILWQLEPTFQLGLSVRSTESSALSLYSDFAGTLDIESDVAVLLVEATPRFSFAESGPVIPYLGVRVGAAITATRTTQRVDLNELGSRNSVLSGGGIGYTAGVFTGASVPLGRVSVFGEVGAHLSEVSNLEGQIDVNGTRESSGSLPFDLDLSGWSAQAGISVGL